MVDLLSIFWLWVLSAALIGLTAYILPGVSVKNFGNALIVALVLGLVNAFIRPLLVVLTLPLNILTLGLLTFVINALLILLVAAIVPNFKVNGFWSALLFSLIYSIFRLILASLFGI